jgi:hypothetical protein
MNTCISLTRGSNPRLLRQIITLGAIACTALSQAQNFSYNDPTLSNFFYSKTSWTLKGNEFVTTSNHPNGNPGNSRSVILGINTNGSGGIFTSHVSIASVCVLPPQGITHFKIGIDSSYQDSAATHMNLGFVIEQGGNIYWTGSTSFSHETWQRHELDLLTETSFQKFDINAPGYSVAGVHPSFSGGAPNIRFGFMTSHLGGEDSYSSARFDNFSVLGTASPVPEPASLATLAVGAIALIRKRKKANS